MAVEVISVNRLKVMSPTEKKASLTILFNWLEIFYAENITTELSVHNKWIVCSWYFLFTEWPPSCIYQITAIRSE
jgi:hypothetical protein